MSYPMTTSWWGQLRTSGSIHHWTGYGDAPGGEQAWYSMCGLERQLDDIDKLEHQPVHPYRVCCKRCKHKKLVRDGR